MELTSEILLKLANQIKGRVLRHLIRDQAKQVALLEAAMDEKLKILQEENQALLHQVRVLEDLIDLQDPA